MWKAVSRQREITFASPRSQVSRKSFDSSCSHAWSNRLPIRLMQRRKAVHVQCLQQNLCSWGAAESTHGEKTQVVKNSKTYRRQSFTGDTYRNQKIQVRLLWQQVQLSGQSEDSPEGKVHWSSCQHSFSTSLLTSTHRVISMNETSFAIFARSPSTGETL